MAKIVLVHFILLSVVSNGLTLNIRDIFGYGFQRGNQPEVQPTVVEVIRWRQPVCLTAAPGVLPCLISSKNVQQYNQNEPDEKLETPEGLKTLADEDTSEEDDSEDEDVLAKRSVRETATPKLLSSRVVGQVRLENMGDSKLRETTNDGRQGRYLRIAPQLARTSQSRQVTYVTKVIDSPVIAKLIADTCLPDIGIPLCDELILSSQYDPVKPTYLPYPVTVNKPIQVTNSAPPQSSQIIQKPNIIQNIDDYLHRPTVVQTQEKPEIKPVIVVQPAKPPGIFAGINALLPNGGNWFNVFNKPAGQQPWFVPSPISVPQIPSLQDILYKPENDISNNPGVLGLLNLPYGQSSPGAGPPTEKPGIFGGLFPSPVKPEGIDAVEVTSVKPSLLDGIGNIFNRPTNKPLVIERPDQKPILVEKPVYVVEKPVVPGLLDIFQRPEKPVELDGAEKPEVIKEPVYVLQKPTELPSLFGGGLLGNWNIFNKPTTSAPSTLSPAHPTPDVATLDKATPKDPIVVINKVPTFYTPVIAPVNPGLPAFPGAPTSSPDIVYIDSAKSSQDAGNPEDVVAASSDKGVVGKDSSKDTTNLETKEKKDQQVTNVENQATPTVQENSKSDTTDAAKEKPAAHESNYGYKNIEIGEFEEQLANDARR